MTESPGTGSAILFFVAESTVTAVFGAGTDLGTGNSICDSAMTISERKRARKKRLSI
jgi:hypothetical protein